MRLDKNPRVTKDNPVITGNYVIKTIFRNPPGISVESNKITK